MLSGTGPITTFTEAAKCLSMNPNSLLVAHHKGHLRAFRINGVMHVVAKEWLNDYYNHYCKYRNTRKLDWDAAEWTEYSGAIMGLPEAAEELGTTLSAIHGAYNRGILRGLYICDDCVVTRPDWLEEYTRSHRNGTQRYKGVHWDRCRNKWAAHISQDGREYYVGRFDSEEVAHEAYLEAERDGIEKYRGKRRIKEGLRSSNKSGQVGVAWASRRGQWVASIKIDGRYKHLGYFDDLDGAVQARLRADRERDAINFKKKTTPKHNTSGFKGVYWDRSKEKWRVFIQIEGRRQYLGHFDRIEDAAQSREDAVRRLEIERHNGRVQY